MPTYNRGKIIISILQALAKQTLTDEEMEVIVVNDGSTDDTANIIDKWISDCSRKYFKLINIEKNGGKSIACNKGILEASSPYILFTDDDCLPDPHWAEHHLNRQLTSSMPTGIQGAVSFPKKWLEKSNFVRYFQGRYVGNRPWRTVKGNPDNLPPNLIGGANVSYPRESLLSVGLFIPGLGRGQDCELAYRLWKAGVKFVFDPRPRIIHVSSDMVSLDVWLSKYLTLYNTSFLKMNTLYPEFIQNFGHWFLLPPRPGQESLFRTLIKMGLRTISNIHLAQKVREYLVRTDGNPRRYHPCLYLYVITAFSLKKIKELEQSHVVK